MTDIIIGADISKDHIDLYRLPDGKHLKITNDRKGFCLMIKWIGDETVSHVVYEPTGAYHKKFERFMLSRGLPLFKVNPRFAKCFGKAMGQLAKTDKEDAKMLAHYATMGSLRPVNPASLAFQELKELHIARLALVRERVALNNRSKQLTMPLLKRQHAQALKRIKADIAAIDRELLERIKADETLKARFDILVSIPRISTITAFALLIEMPELGSLDAKTSAALCGLAPMSRQSGKWKGKAFIQAGRSIVRKALYMPAVGLIRSKTTLAEKYQSLIKAGKPPKVAITAIMRKMIVMANALLKKNKKWTPINA